MDLTFRCVALVILSGVAYITCFPFASSPCLLGYLWLCFSGFCAHSSPAAELPVLSAAGFPRMLFWSVVNSAGRWAGNPRDLEVAAVRDRVPGLVLTGVREAGSNTQFLIFCEVLELDEEKLRPSYIQQEQKQLICLCPRFSEQFQQWYNSERYLSTCIHLLSPYLSTSGIVSLPYPPAAKRHPSRFPLSYGITSG